MNAIIIKKAPQDAYDDTAASKSITAGELIKILSQYDADTPVIIKLGKENKWCAIPEKNISYDEVAKDKDNKELAKEVTEKFRNFEINESELWRVLHKIFRSWAGSVKWLSDYVRQYGYEPSAEGEYDNVGKFLGDVDRARAKRPVEYVVDRNAIRAVRK